GNGSHVKGIVTSFKGIQYTGIDISPTMVSEAQHINTGLDNVTFLLTDGNTIPFDESLFDKIFTANTIYFWSGAQDYAIEIARVLRPGGIFSIAFIPKSTMQHIPFAKFGFTFYNTAAVTSLLQRARLSVIKESLQTEFVTSNSGEKVEREFVII
ncbi:class I SAM-dependent methyltransferase, partial [Xanthomonas citri pv. citri]